MVAKMSHQLIDLQNQRAIFDDYWARFGAQVKRGEGFVDFPTQDEMASYHAQSLSIHHGSWSPGFSGLILDIYYPAKIAKFELPETPEEALALLSTGNSI